MVRLTYRPFAPTSCKHLPSFVNPTRRGLDSNRGHAIVHMIRTKDSCIKRLATTGCITIDSWLRKARIPLRASGATPKALSKRVERVTNASSGNIVSREVTPSVKCPARNQR